MSFLSPENLLALLAEKFPSAHLELVTDTSPSAQHGILLDPQQAAAIATFLRDDPALRLDLCSNVTGLDWPDQEITVTEKISQPDPEGGPDKIEEKKVKQLRPGFLEAVYHLYSVEKKSPAPIALHLRTVNRTDATVVPSFTPVWRSCEFQEREVFDLFGITFSGHPDLRRLLMWDSFADHPMRKDYVEPDDYEWEPTPHDTVLEKAKAHWNASPPPETSRGDAENAEPKP